MKIGIDEYEEALRKFNEAAVQDLIRDKYEEDQFDESTIELELEYHLYDLMHDAMLHHQQHAMNDGDFVSAVLCQVVIDEMIGGNGPHKERLLEEVESEKQAVKQAHSLMEAGVFDGSSGSPLPEESKGGYNPTSFE